LYKLLRYIPAGLAAALFAGAVHATPVSTDATDLWYNPNEPGWGVSMYQQQNIVFAVLFVYGTNNQTTWYVASALTYPGTNPAAGVFFTGALYQTTGPYFGAATFNPAAVGVRRVGDATFTFDSLTTGTFSYTVDGVAVTKNVTRQLWAINTMSGRYVGGQAGTYSDCPASGINGSREEPGTFTVNHTGSSATLGLVAATTSCTYNGPYAQAGHYGLLSGTFSCANGSSGNFSAFAIDTQINGITARIETIATDGCRYTGRIGGVRSF
jgi:hypothetical protein